MTSFYNFNFILFLLFTFFFTAISIKLIPRVVSDYLNKKSKDFSNPSFMVDSLPAETQPKSELSSAKRFEYRTISEGNESSEKIYDAIIIGSGVVGSSLAFALSKQNRNVLVIEKSMGKNVDKNRIVGELLQPSGVHILSKLGLEKVMKKIKHSPIDGYKIIHGNKVTVGEYPKKKDGTVEKGMAFRNYRLIESIRNEIIHCQNVEMIEGKVTQIENSIESGDKNPTVTYERRDAKQAEKIKGKIVFVCDGCFSSFRTKERKKAIVKKGYFMGMVMKNVKLNDSQKAICVFNDPSNLLIYPIGSNELRLLIDFKTKDYQSSKLTPEFFKKVGRLIPKDTKKAYEVAVEERKYRVMPNLVLHADRARGTKIVYLGDSLNMRHPITGAGMTVGLTDVFILSEKLKFLTDFSCAKVNKKIDEFFAVRQKANATLNILACAFYDLMDAKDPRLVDAYFEYISEGGYRIVGPMRLISGISRNEFELTFHFFAVGLKAVMKELKGSFSLGKFFNAADLLKKAVQIYVPLLRKESGNVFLRNLSSLIGFGFGRSNVHKNRLKVN